jgi:transcriptional regulator of met regulon
MKKNKVITILMLLIVIPIVFIGCDDISNESKVTSEDYTAEEHSFPKSDISKITVTAEDSDISVILSDVNEVTVVCMNAEKDYHEVNEAAGNLKIINQKSHTISSDSVQKKITIELPQGMEENLQLDLKTTYGKIEVAQVSTNGDIICEANDSKFVFQKVKAGNLKLKTTYDEITMEDVSVAQKIEVDSNDTKINLSKVLSNEIQLETTYAEIKATEVENANKFSIDGNDLTIAVKNLNSESIDIKSSYGKIDFTKVEGQQINIDSEDTSVGLNETSVNQLKLETSYGDVKGSIVGNYSDYNVKSKNSVGENNLKNQSVAGDKTIDIDVDDGSILIDFVN